LSGDDDTNEDSNKNTLVNDGGLREAEGSANVGLPSATAFDQDFDLLPSPITTPQSKKTNVSRGAQAKATSSERSYPTPESIDRSRGNAKKHIEPKEPKIEHGNKNSPPTSGNDFVSVLCLLDPLLVFTEVFESIKLIVNKIREVVLFFVACFETVKTHILTPITQSLLRILHVFLSYGKRCIAFFTGLVCSVVKFVVSVFNGTVAFIRFWQRAPKGDQDPDSIKATKQDLSDVMTIRQECIDNIGKLQSQIKTLVELSGNIESGFFINMFSVDADWLVRYWTRDLPSWLSSLHKITDDFQDIVTSIDEFLKKPFSFYDTEAACEALSNRISQLGFVSNSRKKEVAEALNRQLKVANEVVNKCLLLHSEKMENFDWLRSKVEKAAIAFYNEFKSLDILLLLGFVSSLHGTTELEREFARLHLVRCEEIFGNGHVPSMLTLPLFKTSWAQKKLAGSEPLDLALKNKGHLTAFLYKIFATQGRVAHKPYAKVKPSVAQPLASQLSASQQSVPVGPTINKTSQSQPVAKSGRVPLRGVTRGLKLSSPQPASDAAVDAVLAGACGNDEVDVPFNSSLVPGVPIPAVPASTAAAAPTDVDDLVKALSSVLVPGVPIPAVPASTASAAPTDVDDLVKALSSVSVKRDEFDEMVDAFTLLSINTRRQHSIYDAVDSFKSMSLEKHRIPRPVPVDLFAFAQRSGSPPVSPISSPLSKFARGRIAC
ncbi:hypothetical protein HDU76_002034, partial [Blyttiomyces sp. JEL0837]